MTFFIFAEVCLKRGLSLIMNLSLYKQFADFSWDFTQVKYWLMIPTWTPLENIQTLALK